MIVWIRGSEKDTLPTTHGQQCKTTNTPLPINRTKAPFGALPEGWTTAFDQSDGRMYYWHMPSGTTSFTHPSAADAQAVMAPADCEGLSTNPVARIARMYSNRNINCMTSQAMTSAAVIESSLYAHRRPNTHECNACTALFCCPLFGAMACYHSFSVNRKWRQGRYGEAVDHSRQASKYASFATFLGLCFWIFWLCMGPDGRFHWPKVDDFRFGF